tara:strand:+ start:159 stop:362 length:204 start_codon:yes stop_codon:yes gene_type:complete
MIPETFEDWKSCITKGCKIKLTKNYAKNRLVIYLDIKNKETQKFISLYGYEHLKNIQSWFTIIAEQD